MNPQIIHECLTQSFADTPFPIVAAQLAAAGVVSYRADLIRLRKTYYGAAAESLDEDLALPHAPAIPTAFDPNQMHLTVRAIQQGQIGYAAFLRRIMQAGCASYEVFLRGRKVAYRGRDGADYIELMPLPATSY